MHMFAFNVYLLYNKKVYFEIKKQNFKKNTTRKGGRVVEGTALEKRHTRKGIESSNLSLSATNEVSVRKGR